MAEEVALGTYCLRYKRGDSFPSQFTITQSDGVTPINITSWQFTLTVDTQRNPADNTTNQFSVAGVITDAANGVVQFSPSESDTDLSPAKYWYDIQQIDGAGRKKTIVKDNFIIEQDITKT